MGGRNGIASHIRYKNLSKLVRLGMPAPQSLSMECNRCRVASTCPSKGSSPLVYQKKNVAVCRLLGGYGRTPVDRTILSPEMLLRSERDGECLTFAEVPRYEEGVGILTDLVMIFSPPVLHEREKNVMTVDSIYPRSHKT